MAKKSRRIELRTLEGKLIICLHLIETEMDSNEKPEQAGKKPENEPKTRRGGNQGGGSGNGELMSDAQKRFLFRILADQGLEGENAYKHLKNLFDVSNLQEITKQDASREISRLLEEAKGGGGNGSSL